MNHQFKQRDSATDYDPVYLHCRRESVVLLIGFGMFFLWCLGVSYFCGYGLSTEEAARSVLGIPRWVFWGVAVPWLAADVFTFWFCLFYMAEDPLGEALDEQRLSDGPDPGVEARKEKDSL
jgi:hypothetical protein